MNARPTLRAAPTSATRAILTARRAFLTTPRDSPLARRRHQGSTRTLRSTGFRTETKKRQQSAVTFATLIPFASPTRQDPVTAARSGRVPPRPVARATGWFASVETVTATPAISSWRTLPRHRPPFRPSIPIVEMRRPEHHRRLFYHRPRRHHRHHLRPRLLHPCSTWTASAFLVPTLASGAAPWRAAMPNRREAAAPLVADRRAAKTPTLNSTEPATVTERPTSGALTNATVVATASRLNTPRASNGARSGTMPEAGMDKCASARGTLLKTRATSS